LRVNLNEAPSTKTTTKNKTKRQSQKKQTKKQKKQKSRLRFASLLKLRNKKQKSKPSNEIYEYLKTFSKYRERKPGLLKNYNQQIAYNFNSQNLSLSLRGLEALINNSVNKIEPLIINSFKIKTNEKEAKRPWPTTTTTTTTTTNINKTINIKDF